MKKVISVIVPLYYGKCYIESMISQLEKCADETKDYKIQLVFFNDAPEQMIEDIYDSDKISIRIINAEYNGGIHKARVKGLQSSNGNYILFLDQDDRVRKNYFSSQLSQISDRDAVVCGALSGGKVKYNLDRPLDKTISRQNMVNEGNLILSPGQVLLRREAIPMSWIESCVQNNGADDWLLWLCMHSEGKRFTINQEILFIREVHYHNASTHTLEMSMSEQEVVSVIEKKHLLSEEERNTLKALLPELQKKRIKESEKWKQMFLIQNDWFWLCNHEKSMVCYLKKRNIQKVAIYGYGYLGKTLLEYLEREKVEVACIIDKNAAFLEVEKKCCTLEDMHEPIEGVIISLLKNGNFNLEDRIRAIVHTDVVWLEDIVAEMCYGISQ